jgi:hypothetical protein
MSGVSVAMPSRTAAREGARLTTRVLPDTPTEPPRQPGVDGARGQPGRADRLGDAGNRPVEDARRRVRGDVTRRDARAPHRDHEVDAADHRGVERVADRDRVTGHRSPRRRPPAGPLRAARGPAGRGVLALPVAHGSSTTTTSARPIWGGGHLHDATVAGGPEGGRGEARERTAPALGGGAGADADPSRPPTAGHHGRGPSTDTRHDAIPFINLCGRGRIIHPVWPPSVTSTWRSSP